MTSAKSGVECCKASMRAKGLSECHLTERKPICPIGEGLCHQGFIAVVS